MSDSAFIASLIKGHKQFRHAYLATDPYADYRHYAAHSQAPSIMAITCIDSRVTPEIITQSPLGTYLSVRHFAAFVPPFAANNTHVQTIAAAVHVAVHNLHIRDIAIIGHSHCAGVRALLSTPKEALQTPITPCLDTMAAMVSGRFGASPQVPFAQQCEQCTHALVVAARSNLMAYPTVRTACEQGNLTVHGWYFDIAAAVISAYDDSTGQFLSW